MGEATRIIQALDAVQVEQAALVSKVVTVSELRVSMILDEDVMNVNGLRIAPKGQEVTSTLQARLRNFAGGAGIVQPFRVLAPQ